MENKKNIMLKNLTNGELILSFPELHYKRTFERQGVMKPMPLEILEEAIWDTGFSNMLKSGAIEIVDKEVGKENGIVAATTVEEFNEAITNQEVETVVLVLDDKQKKRYMTVAPISELKQVLLRLTRDQREELAEFAVNNRLLDIDRAEVLQQITGIDIIERAKKKKQMEE